MTVAKEFADALDNEDYATLTRLLTSDCHYETADGTLVGPEAIVHSYRRASERAKTSLERVRYESRVRPEREDAAIVTFMDHLEHEGRRLTYTCEQMVHVDTQGGISRIVHRDLHGQRDALDAFLREVGLDRQA